MGAGAGEGSRSAEGGTCEALVTTACAALGACEGVLMRLPEGAMTAQSRVLGGGTIGKHVRHVVDHYAAALLALEQGGVIDYDKRDRDVPSEKDRGAALESLSVTASRLRGLAREDLDRPVRVRVMIDGTGREMELNSTLGRELAFATHHAVHHQAFVGAIAAELGVKVEMEFGRAPSTVHHDRGTGRGAS
jgi:uncharacterized damage-inducible protein DinB